MSDDKMMKRDQQQPANVEPRYRTVAPGCDIYENSDEFLVVAEVPGVEENDVDLRLDRTQLTIEALRSSGATHRDGTRLRYARVFEVPDTIDAAKITAKLEHGVLSVHLPKAPEARVRRISVRAG
jgi:HSP20 family molecular chaperone IbpA